MPRYPSEPQDPSDHDEEAPVAVGGTTWSFEDERDEQDQDPATTGSTDEVMLPPGAEDLEPADTAVHNPRAEIATGVACFALALSTLLPWYGSPDATVSGFASGSWGPVVFFLGIAGAIIVALRLFKVPIAFPLEHGVILEGIGWASVAAIIAKRYFLPSVNGFELPLSQAWFLRIFNGLMVSLLCAVAVALLAGRLSAGNPFMIKPGWLAGFAGKLGIAILGVSVLAGISFGFFNSNEALEPQAEGRTITTKGKAPACMKIVPIPSGVKIVKGTDHKNADDERTACVVEFTNRQSLTRTTARFATLLQRQKIAFRNPKVGSANAATSRLLILEPQPCGVISVAKVSARRVSGSIILSYGAVCQYSVLGQTQQSPPG